MIERRKRGKREGKKNLSLFHHLHKRSSRPKNPKTDAKNEVGRAGSKGSGRAVEFNA
jgi:hypothetical protein